MIIGVLRVSLLLPSRTLKEKRTIVRSLIERLRNRFNASVAEIDALDDPASASIGIVCLSNDATHAGSQLQTILRAIEESRLDAELAGVETELIPL
jgi:hypothetical protein